MATIAQLTQQVIRILSAQDQSKDSQLDKREVKLLIIQELNYAIKMEYYANSSGMDKGVSGQYIATFVQSVARDTVRGETYITVPTPYVAIGGTDKGIKEVSPMNDNQQSYVPTANGAKNIYRGLPAGNLEQRVGFYPERDKIYFSQDIMKKGVSKVRLKLIVASGDDMVIDPAIESTIRDKAVAVFSKRGEQDRLNDQVDQ